MSLIDFIKNLFASPEKVQIPEDSMLRRHYFQNLEANKDR